ncbi:hypothetical protein BGZ60DRAFT_149266 [Tricladium varicosporioides]|nr:hypothetical protein BGZ60DRAFT_149266 [Hymenoscyphus varicosporioides]
MEPLSVATGVVALLAHALTASTYITGVVRTTKSAPAELIEIKQGIESLTSVLQRLQAVFIDETNVKNDTPAKDSQGLGADMESSLKACIAIMKETEDKIREVNSLSQKGLSFEKIKSSFAWQPLRKELQELRVRLEYSKSSILMCLQLHSLAVLETASKASLRTEASMKELQNEIRGKAQQRDHTAAGTSWAPLVSTLNTIPIEEEGREGSQYQTDALRLGIGQSQEYPLRSRPTGSELSNLDLLCGYQQDFTSPNIRIRNGTHTEQTHVIGTSSQISASDHGNKPEKQQVLEVHSSMNAWLSGFRPT